MSYFEESERCKVHLMEGGKPLVKVLILKRTGLEQNLVVNEDVFLNGGTLSVETWLVNEHGIWNGTTNFIELFVPYLKAGEVYNFTSIMWDEPTPTADKKASPIIQ